MTTENRPRCIRNFGAGSSQRSHTRSLTALPLPSTITLSGVKHNQVLHEKNVILTVRPYCTRLQGYKLHARARLLAGILFVEDVRQQAEIQRLLHEMVEKRPPR